MKRKLSLFAILFFASGIMFTSCKNSDEEINSTEPTTLKVEKYSIGECPDSIDVSNLFSKYSTITRSLGSASKFDGYDFSSAYLLNVEEKEGDIFMVPAIDSINNEDFLIGVGTSKNIAYQLYFKKTSEERYTLFNESKEPLFTVSYDKETCLAVVTNIYGNDVSTIPVSRVRGGWFTAGCSVAISAGCYGLSVIGDVPSGGASLGLAACSTIICLALC